MGGVIEQANQALDNYFRSGTAAMIYLSLVGGINRGFMLVVRQSHGSLLRAPYRTDLVSTISIYQRLL